MARACTGRFESWLKRREDRLGTTIGLVGELAAVRADAWRPIPEDVVNDDFWVALDVIEQGYRVAYEPCAGRSIRPRRRWEPNGSAGPGSCPAASRSSRDGGVSCDRRPARRRELRGHRLVRLTVSPLSHLALLALSATKVRSSALARTFLLANLFACAGLAAGARCGGVPGAGRIERFERVVRLLAVVLSGSGQVMFLQAVVLGGMVRYAVRRPADHVVDRGAMSGGTARSDSCAGVSGVRQECPDEDAHGDQVSSVAPRTTGDASGRWRLPAASPGSAISCCARTTTAAWTGRVCATWGLTCRAVPRARHPAGVARGVVANASVSAGRFWSTAMIETVREAAGETALDLLQVEYQQMVPWVRDLPARMSVLDLHNVESDLVASYVHTRRGLRARSLRGEAAALERMERRTVGDFDHVVVVSEKEKSRLPAGARSVLVCPNGKEPSAVLPDAPDATVAFVATMGWAPNVDAAVWLGREIWPKVLARVPHAHLLLVGQDPAPSVLALAGEHVEVTGTVADVTPYLARSRVVVAPLRAGGGTRLKILEALDAGRPVVATSVGCEGMEDLVGRGVIVAEPPSASPRRSRDFWSNPPGPRAWGGRAMMPWRRNTPGMSLWLPCSRRCRGVEDTGGGHPPRARGGDRRSVRALEREAKSNGHRSCCSDCWSSRRRSTPTPTACPRHLPSGVRLHAAAVAGDLHHPRPACPPVAGKPPHRLPGRSLAGLRSLDVGGRRRRMAVPQFVFLRSAQPPVVAGNRSLVAAEDGALGAPRDDAPILDVCTGTGDLALAYSRKTAGRLTIVGADFCRPMLAIGRRKAPAAGPRSSWCSWRPTLPSFRWPTIPFRSSA